VLNPASAELSACRSCRRLSAPPPEPGEPPLATRTLSRRALRDQNDEVEPPEDGDTDGGEETPAPKVKKARARKGTGRGDKKPAKTRVRKKAIKAPQRMFARWAVCDNGMKRVAVFDYRDRAAADARLIQIRESKSGTFFLLLVKDPYDPPAEPATPVATA
jgi:hypothetical protein